MVKHIIIWTLKDCYDASEKAEIAKNIKTNVEGLKDKIDGIVFNPAAYTHTSVAILDALKAVKIPTVEVHISKVDEREDFRQISYIRQIAIKTITGKGFLGYCEGIDAIIDYLKGKKI